MNTDIKATMFLEKPVLIIVLIITIAAMIHTALKVHMAVFFDFLPELIWTVIAFIVIGLLDLLQFDWDDGGDEPVDHLNWPNVIALIESVLVLVPIVLMIFFSYYKSLKDLIELAAKPNITEYQRIFFGCFISCLIAYSLFIFRLRKRILYGVTELGIGFLVSLHHISSLGKQNSLEPSLILAILTAGVYLMVRGLDNIHVGYDNKASLISQVKNEIRGNSISVKAKLKAEKKRNRIRTSRRAD